MVWWRSRIECDDWQVVLCSRSNLKHWMYMRIFDSLSIVLWIALVGGVLVVVVVV